MQYSLINVKVYGIQKQTKVFKKRLLVRCVYKSFTGAGIIRLTARALTDVTSL